MELMYACLAAASHLDFSVWLLRGCTQFPLVLLGGPPEPGRPQPVSGPDQGDTLRLNEIFILWSEISSELFPSRTTVYGILPYDQINSSEREISQHNKLNIIIHVDDSPFCPENIFISNLFSEL